MIYKFLRQHWDKCIIGILVLLYAVIFSTLSVLRHNSFASNFDLSNMDHTIWNTLYGNFFSLRFEENFVSRLSVHADFILILLSPMYLIWNDVRALLISASIFMALGAIPTYLIAIKVLKNKIAALTIVLLYLLNPGMQWTNLYDFHGVSLVIPFMLFAFYFAYVKKWKLYALFIVLALLTKENISLNIAMLGLFVFFGFKKKLIGLATFVVGLVWFFTMVYVVMPHFSPSDIHWALEGLGDGSANPVPGIIKNNMDINTFIQTFFNKSAIDYYILLFKPFAFLPLLGLPWLFLSAPEFVVNILRGTTTIHFHYDSGITASLVIASIFGLYFLLQIINKIKPVREYAKVFLYIFCVGMIVVALRVNYNYSPLPTSPSCWCMVYSVSEEDKQFEKALQNIPKDASVTASLEVRPHVNHRRDVWFVPSATHSAQYIALIKQNRIIGNYEPKDFENKLIPVLLSSKDHKVRFSSEHFYLFERVKQD